tara:strand:- start:254 stop:481 length:228 start_codon:yes stop_codon:yes gene_type:complete
MKKPLSAFDNNDMLIICAKFRKANMRCTMKVIRIAAMRPKNREKFTTKNSKLLRRKYVSLRVFKSVTSDVCKREK